jgi:cardiolipin synthase (CMP-forming)
MFSIPNCITLVRLALAPVVILAILRGEHLLALALFAAAAATDGLDGMLARRFGWMTALGAYLDPLADKVLLSGVYLALAAAGILPWWFVGLIFARDVLILAGALWARLARGRREFPPSRWGKASTLLQSVTAVAWLARNVLDLAAANAVAEALIWPAAAMTLWSGLDYGRRALRAD